MGVLERVQKVMTADIDDAQLDRFLSEVRDSLATSSRQFLAFQTLIVGSLVTYHSPVVYGGISTVSFSNWFKAH